MLREAESKIEELALENTILKHLGGGGAGGGGEAFDSLKILKRVCVMVPDDKRTVQVRSLLALLVQKYLLY
jgi:hypothetical protein